MKRTGRGGARQGGFTLIEVLVTSLLVAVAVVAVFGGISSLTRAQFQAQSADLLQRLASEKLDDLRILSDPASDGSSGDFSDRGYPNITWNMDEEPTGTTNLDQVTVTVTEGRQSQSLTTMMFVAPLTTTTTGSGAGGGAAGGTSP